MVQKESILWQSLSAMGRNYKFLLIPFTLDVLFFYVLTWLHIEVFSQISIHTSRIATIIEQKAASLSQTQLVGFETSLMSSPEFVTNYHAILGNIALFFGGGFLLWIVCQGGNWYLAHRFVSRTPFFKYLGRFVLSSVVWFVILIGLLFLLISLLELSAESVVPYLGPSGSNALVFFLILVLGYLAAVSYTGRGLRESVALSLKKAYPLSLHFIGYVLFFGLLLLNGTWFYELHWGALLAFFLFVVVPSCTLARVHTVVAVQQFRTDRKGFGTNDVTH